MLTFKALSLPIFIIIVLTKEHSTTDVLIDSLNYSFVNQTYTLKTFNSESNSCETIQNINNKYIGYEMIYINDDTSSDYKHLTGLENSANKILVGTKHEFELSLIVLGEEFEFKEFSLKVISCDLFHL